MLGYVVALHNAEMYTAWMPNACTALAMAVSRQTDCRIGMVSFAAGI